MDTVPDTEDSHEIPTYVPHDGTLRISGSTLPKKAGSCALHFIERAIFPIDFFCIGANANQQAMKAMGVFVYLLNKDKEQPVTAAFQPLRFKTETSDPVTGEKRDRDCAVWRTVLISKEYESTVRNTPRTPPRDKKPPSRG